MGMKRKILSLLLCFVMVLSLLPTAAFAADEVESYGVWVNGEQFTSEKLTIDCGSGTATYDPNNATLTLNNATITQTHEFDVDSRVNSGIFADGDLTVQLVGSNSIQLRVNNATSGVVSEGNLVVTGTGDLIVSVDPGDKGIYASESITISGSGNVNINCENVGFCSDHVTINGSANVTVTALETWTSSFTLLGSGNVDITGNYCGIKLLHNATAVQLKGSGRLTIHSGNGYQAVYNEDNPESLVILENPDNYTVMGAPDTDYVSYVPSTAYDVWVNGVQFTSARLTIDCGGTAIYDPDTATLKLDGAQITQTHEFTDEMAIKTSSAIYAKGDLTVNRVGESRIEPISDAATSGSGIYVEGELVITGTEDLAIDSDGESYGIWASSLTISGSGCVNIDTENIGIYANTTAVKDSVKVNVDSDLYGVFTRNGSFSLLGSGDVSISGDENGVVLWEDCTVQLNGTGNLNITAGSGKKAVYNENNPESPVTLQNPDNYVVTRTPDSDYVYYEYSPFRNLWVNGEQFSAQKFTIECGSGTATYDPVTATVTLNGAQITQTHADSGFSGAIYAGRDITLNVVGDSSISLGEYAIGDGIYTAGNLTVMGNKALNITIKYENGYSDAVWVNGGKLTVDMEGDLTVDSTGTALSSTDDILISGSGSKTIRAGANGIYSSGADIKLSGSGDVTIDAGYGIYAQTGKAELAGSGNVTITSAKNGTYSSGDMILSGTGEVNITGNDNAVLLHGSAGELKLNGKNTAITLTAGDGNMAVYNDATGKTPVAGDNFDAYKCVIGSPDASAVTYKMEHGIVSEADCTTPQICMICHKVAGPALDHLTTAPDCTVPVFCLRCHEQIGPALGHDFTGEYKDNGDGTHSRICTRCNEYGAAENHSYEDYVCACGAEDLAGAKEAAEEAILAEQGDDTSEAVVKAVEDAIAAIDAATTVAEVNAAMEDGIAAIRAAKAGNVPPAPVTYTIIDGANSVWTKGSNSGLAVRSDAPFVKFVGVKVDGEIVAAINYTAKEGSTMVNLTPAYLETLEVGIHSLEIVSNDGSASTNFTVKANSQPADSENPQTGDSGMIYLWALIFVVSAAGLSATAIYSRKRKIK